MTTAAKFLGKTVLERKTNKIFKVRCALGFENENFKVLVKKGLLTDGASIPKVFWSIIGCPLSGQYIGSAIIHDALYHSQLLTKRQSDELFLDMLKHNKVNTIKRNIMYYALKLFGSHAWNKVTEETAQNTKQFITVHCTLSKS